MRDFAVVVPWVNNAQRILFLEQWGVSKIPDWLILQQDELREGCGVTKNNGILRADAEVVVVLDDDCFPDIAGPSSLEDLAAAHIEALQPQNVELFQMVTEPPSRGTPYSERSISMPVAASMGFWTGIGDHCAVRQLATNSAPMKLHQSTIYGRYFPLCGMNLAFRVRDWWPWCQFIDVPRFDDIWMGWLWQHEAYRRGFCFNLSGPLVRHARQSNVWKNLQQESVHLEASETLWRTIALAQHASYAGLRSLLPV